MGLMTKMRDNAHVFIIVFAVVFIAFWVVSDLDIGSLMQGSRNEIAKIGEKSISYQEFQDVVERIAEQRRQQNNGKELTENDYIQIREQVWNDYVTQGVVEQAIEEFGITVNDEEIADWVWGPNPPQELTQYFIDSTGQFNRDAYEQFLREPGAENIQALVGLEQQLKSQLLREKLTNILTSAVMVSEEDTKTSFVEQNIDFTTSYVFFDPRVFAAKDTAAPTDDEYREYYEKNKERFKTEEMRKVKYVLFPDIPSKADTAAIVNELNTLRDMVNSGTDFLEVVASSSEEPYDSSKWVNREQAPQAVANTVFDQPVGSIVGPVAHETGLSLFKIVGERSGSATLYQASHILFRTDGGQDEAAQLAKAQQALARARGGADFEKLASELSEEPGAKERGGMLPWFAKDRMVKEFEDAVIAGKNGDIVGPVKTQFGYHVIKVGGRSTRELQLAEIRLSIRSSSGTKDELFERARDFAYFASENGFEKEAQTSQLQVQESSEFTKESGSFIPGIGSNPALVKFSFENSVGDISEVHRVANGYVVAELSGERKAGYRELDELREQLKPQVVFERQMKKTLAAARSTAGGKSLEQIAQSKPGLSVVQTPPFKIQAGVPNVGPDQAYIGTMLRLKQGESSKPFRGLRGIYVMRLDGKGAFDETAYKVKKSELRQQSLSQRQNEFIQNWLEQRKKEISIVDNRDVFFR